MPETKDDIVIHLQRIFSFVDRYVDNYRYEREEEGVADEIMNVRAKLLQVVPDEDLCSLLFKTMRMYQLAVTQLGIELMDKKKMGGGCLNEVSIDVGSLERSKNIRMHYFDQIWKAGMSDPSSDSCSAGEENYKKSTNFSKGHQFSSNSKTLRNMIKEMNEEMQKKDAHIADLEKELGRLMLFSSRIQNGWAGDFDDQSPGYDDSENAKRKLRRHGNFVGNLLDSVSSYLPIIYVTHPHPATYSSELLSSIFYRLPSAIEYESNRSPKEN